MRDINFERLYTEQIRGYYAPLVEAMQQQGAPQQQAPSAPQPNKNDGQAANTSNTIDLEKARQIVAGLLGEFTKALAEKQIGDQAWSNEIFQELGKIMSNKLQDKFAKADSTQQNPPQQQAQPTQPQNPPPQATAQNR